VCLNCRHSYVAHRLWPPTYWNWSRSSKCCTLRLFECQVQTSKQICSRQTHESLAAMRCLPSRCIFNTNKQAIEFSVQPTQLYVYCGLATCFGPNSDPSGFCMTLLKTNVNAYTKMCTSFVTASPQSVSQSQSIPTDITVCCVQRSVCYDNLTIKSQIPIYWDPPVLSLFCSC